MNKSEWLKAVRKVHGTRFDYRKVPEQFGWNDKVPVICKVHGVLMLSAHNHKHGLQCAQCSRETQVLTHEQFVERSRAAHGDYYDYSRVRYTRSSVKVVIGCPEHGWFKQQPNNHISGKGCYQCRNAGIGRALRKTVEQWTAEAREVHGNKYDYSQVQYVNSETDVRITCKRHGAFNQKAQHHLAGSGCPLCVSAKEYNFGRRRMLLQGYEHLAVKWIRDNTKIPVRELFESKHPKAECRPPLFKYKMPDGTIKTYHPDFWVPSRNIVVEVKSAYTAGEEGSEWNIMLKAKRHAVRKAGFKFRLLVLDGTGNLLTTRTKP